jgi:hypothetical protein
MSNYLINTIRYSIWLAFFPDNCRGKGSSPKFPDNYLEKFFSGLFKPVEKPADKKTRKRRPPRRANCPKGQDAKSPA